LIKAFSTRLFSVLRYESVIHEFDPYFNYRTTKYLVEEGFYNFHNWFDDRAWYPLGRIIGGTIYPGKNFTSLSFSYQNQRRQVNYKSIPENFDESIVSVAPNIFKIPIYFKNIEKSNK